MDRLTKTNTIYCKVSKCAKFVNGQRECFGSFCLECNTYRLLSQYENINLTPQQIVEMQNQLAEAMELLEFSRTFLPCNDCSDNAVVKHCKCKYQEYVDKVNKLKQATDINVVVPYIKFKRKRTKKDKFCCRCQFEK